MAHAKLNDSNLPTVMSITGHLIAGSLLSILPFALGYSLDASWDTAILPGMCIGTSFIVGLMMLVKGVWTWNALHDANENQYGD
jgi:hypothetical protein